MSVKCFYVEPTGDASATFADGRVEIHPMDSHKSISGWDRWRPRYRRTDTGEIFDSLSAVPPGGMWDATWFHEDEPRKGGFLGAGVNSDGRFLVVKLPNGHDWLVDARASNCTMPDDDEHRCWVRHGEPPNVTVDKVGLTCAAGAGSIQSGDYHGFLRNGELT